MELGGSEDWALKRSFGRAATMSMDESTSSSSNKVQRTTSIELSESRRISEDGQYSNEALDSTLDEDCCDVPFVKTQCTLTGAKRELYQHVNTTLIYLHQFLEFLQQFILIYFLYWLCVHMQNPSLFFNDGTRKIDFILAWDENTPSTTSQNAFIKRNIFESNLEKEGLELERVNTPGIPLHYIKIHAPEEILRRYAEILKLRMPMKMVYIYRLIDCY